MRKNYEWVPLTPQLHGKRHTIASSTTFTRTHTHSKLFGRDARHYCLHIPRLRIVLTRHCAGDHRLTDRVSNSQSTRSPVRQSVGPSAMFTVKTTDHVILPVMFRKPKPNTVALKVVIDKTGKIKASFSQKKKMFIEPKIATGKLLLLWTCKTFSEFVNFDAKDSFPWQSSKRERNYIQSSPFPDSWVVRYVGACQSQC